MCVKFKTKLILKYCFISSILSRIKIQTSINMTCFGVLDLVVWSSMTELGLSAWSNYSDQKRDLGPPKGSFLKGKISYFRNIQVGLFIVTWLESDIQKIPH